MATKTSTRRNKRRTATIPPKKSRLSWAEVLPILFPLLITVIAFIPSLFNGFVTWDDDVNILKNPNLQVFDWWSIKGIFTDTVIGNYNPLSILSLAIEKAIFGLNPTVIHINNLILHLICVFFYL